MKVERIDKEENLFYTDDGNSFPLFGSDIDMSELNKILENSDAITKEIYKKYYEGNVDES